jgi:hypothetical protein
MIAVSTTKQVICTVKINFRDVAQQFHSNRYNKSSSKKPKAAAKSPGRNRGFCLGIGS